MKIIQCVLSIAISISKPRNSQHPHNMSDSFVPIVPFESYQEYEDGLSELINTYRDMVDASTRENSGSLSKSYGDYSIEWVVKAKWLRNGKELFLVLTKGLGGEWCETMNTMVVHSLDVALRIFAEVSIKSGLLVRHEQLPRSSVLTLLKREISFAIASVNTLPNNMCLFEELNFKYVHLRCPGWEYEGVEGEHLPTVKVQAMKLAFAMVLHSRLGAASRGRFLGDDNVKMILSDETCF